MRKNIVAGLACALLALPGCTEDSGTTTESGTAPTTVPTTDPTAGTTEDATAGMTEDATAGATEDATAGTTAPTTTGGEGSVMEEFGAPCMADADCEEILGAGGVCLTDILMLYGLPGGYCSKLCMLPDGQTAYVEDDAICGEGVTCIGAMGYFEGCVVECTDNSQCPRAGYECRPMPEISSPGDPKFCLMTDENKL